MSRRLWRRPVQVGRHGRRVRRDTVCAARPPRPWRFGKLGLVVRCKMRSP